MCKVIIFVSYTNSLLRTCEGLKQFDPLKLYGETSIRQRANVIQAFQTDDMKRLIVSNIKVGGTGIDLHDTVGNRPRFTFIVPTYSISDVHQAGGRAYRQGTMSTSTIRLVHGKTGTQIVHLIF